MDKPFVIRRTTCLCPNHNCRNKVEHDDENHYASLCAECESNCPFDLETGEEFDDLPSFVRIKRNNYAYR